MNTHITCKTEAIERIGDADIYHEVARNFGSHLPDYAQKIAVSFASSDFAALQRTAHSIKSNCATIGADNLRAFFLSLEKEAENQDQNTLRGKVEQAIRLLAELQEDINSLS